MLFGSAILDSAMSAAPVLVLVVVLVVVVGPAPVPVPVRVRVTLDPLKALSGTFMVPVIDWPSGANVKSQFERGELVSKATRLVPVNLFPETVPVSVP